MHSQRSSEEPPLYTCLGTPTVDVDGMQVWLVDLEEPSHGGPSTLNTSECPNGGVESSLSSILEANVPEKYYLSGKASLGILDRAERRGMRLYWLLRDALIAVVERWLVEEYPEVEGEEAA